jgi:hypothetical protein
MGKSGNFCIAGQATDANIIGRIHITFSITKATNTHSECVTVIAFPWQQWFRSYYIVLFLYFTVVIRTCKSICIYCYLF